MADRNIVNSYMKSVFFGQIREDLIFPYPRSSNQVSETVQMILDSFQRFAREKVRSVEWDEKGKMPHEIVENLAELGMLGLMVPEELGGAGLPPSAYSRIME